MTAAKQIADLLTTSRAFLALLLVWLGLSSGSQAFPLACWLVLAAWTSDCLDGTFARRSPKRFQTWIGDHDLEFDMSVAVGLLMFLMSSGYLNIWIGVIYMLAWVLILWHFGLLSELGKLFQAPIYGWFIYLAVRESPTEGFCLIGLVLTIIIVTWPRFPNDVIPDFLNGMKEVIHFPRARRKT